jgi:hypothetical protein
MPMSHLIAMLKRAHLWGYGGELNIYIYIYIYIYILNVCACGVMGGN